jgi:hypothetical protein
MNKKGDKYYSVLFYPKVVEGIEHNTILAVNTLE